MLAYCRKSLNLNQLRMKSLRFDCYFIVPRVSGAGQGFIKNIEFTGLIKIRPAALFFKKSILFILRQTAKKRIVF